MEIRSGRGETGRAVLKTKPEFAIRDGQGRGKGERVRYRRGSGRAGTERRAAQKRFFAQEKHKLAIHISE